MIDNRVQNWLAMETCVDKIKRRINGRFKQNLKLQLADVFLFDNMQSAYLETCFLLFQGFIGDLEDD